MNLRVCPTLVLATTLLVVATGVPTVSAAAAPARPAGGLTASRAPAVNAAPVRASRAAEVAPKSSPAGPSAATVPHGPGTFVAVTPARLLDTRIGTGAARAPIAAGHTLTLTVGGRGGVPTSGVAAVALNVTATQATGHGYVTVYAHGSPRTVSSNLNFVPVRSGANLVVTKVGSDHQVSLYVGGTGSVQLIADVSGYFVPQAATGDPAGFVAQTPGRVLDTRTGLGAAHAGPVPGGHTIVVDVSLPGGIVDSDDPDTYVLNVTVTAPTANGYVTVFAPGTRRPSTSNLNFAKGQTVADLVLARSSIDGEHMNVFVSATAQVVVDASGFILPRAAYQSGGYVDTPAYRMLDTRSGTGAPRAAVEAGQTVAVQVSGRDTVPSDPLTAVALTVTAVSATVGGVVTAYADGTTRPLASNLNFAAGQTVANAVVVPVGADGEVDLHFAGSGTVHLVADISGFFYGPGPEWHSSPAADPLAGGLYSVSCASSTYCLAAGRPNYRWDGTSAAAVPGPATGVALDHVSCPQVDFCAASFFDGRFELATYDGSTWTAVPDVDVSAVTCVDSRYCIAMANSSYWRWDGSSWTRHPASFLSRSISCALSTMCVSVDGAGHASSFDGTSWSAPVTLGAALSSVSCPTTTMCLAVGTGGASSRFDGQSWSPIAATDGGAQLGTVSCASPTFCAAVDRANGALTYDGARWSTPQSIDRDRPLASVSCPSVGYCVATASLGDLIIYSGNAWSAPLEVSSASGAATSASCAGTTCVLVDYYGSALILGTSSWGRPQRIFDQAGAAVVSCVSDSFCLAVDAPGFVSIHTATSWAAGAPVGSDASDPVVALSCASASFCMAADASGQLRRYDGTAWSLTGQLAVTTGAGLSCPAPTMCILTDEKGRVAEFDGAHWSALSVVTGGGVNEVSCASPTFCIGVAANGVWSRFDGRVWTSFIDDWLLDVTAVSCPSSSFCLAVGYDKAFGFDGTRWSGSRSTGFSDFSHVSCANTTRCVAVDQYEHVETSY